VCCRLYAQCVPNRAGRAPADDSAHPRLATGVANTIDPLGGAYFVEALTDRMEELCYAYFAKIDQLGGMVEAVKRGYPQREIADAAFTLQRAIDSGQRIVVGVNDYLEGDEAHTPILRIDPALERKQSSACEQRRRTAMPRRPRRASLS
jgi:methylmalonyl-CoA mutase N-terminal domain/subunit